MNIIKGMNVKVISGNHKGSEGKVLYVLPKKERIIIEGINLIKKHIRPTQENPKGGVVEKEGTIHISNVMVVNDGKTTRLNYKILEDGTKVRISNKTGNQIN
ncbi:MAG: 50S ribosomal protein L24 [Candidatus Marinimicrobia bacterium]|nr:50S ribosomal protein L24 [Candidatus Neomarinimicrobiota bacterium]